MDKHGDTWDGYCSPKSNHYVAYEFLKGVLKPYTAERKPNP
ncbi:MULTISPECIES: hypothetical protein [Providencia]|nr:MULTISPECIES: hypothetical protein [Providencia]